MSTVAVRLSRQPVLTDALVRRSVVADAGLVLGAAALTALAAQVVIPVHGLPVPITGQTFAVLLTAAALGPARGVLGQLVYLLAGLVGLPVYAGATSGAHVLLGASGGYLVGFVLAAALMGIAARHGYDRRPLGVAVSYALGTLVIYACGASVLALVTHVGLVTSVRLGVLPFLGGDLVKAVAAAAALPGAWWLVRRTGGR
ncbi:MAG: biotin transporter BioY [Actinomycetes bacterium]